MTDFRILSKQVLCKQAGRYIGWPSVAQAATGDVLAVFSGDRDHHTSPDGKTQMVRSCDGGRTWGPPQTIHDTPLDDRDSGIIKTYKDTLLVSWFTGPGEGEWKGHWTIRSSDNGSTWEAAVRTEVTTPHGPIQLSNGRLLFVGQRPHESHGQDYDVGLQASNDDGCSWHTVGTFPVPAGAQMLSFDEVHAVECASGKVVVLFRDCYGEHYIRQSHSVDGGQSWAAPYGTPIRGLPPHLIRLADNRLLVVYAKRWEPYGVYACISRDEGVSWDVNNEIQLSEGLNGDLGYPASVLLDDGSIMTVYYQIDAVGEKPCLMGTHWCLE
jgi:sialidase-1